ncbi:MAG: CHRD domain-containing protein [Chloroflexota bacterium]|nr:CHRD domain-containing protein [Chloroflexota bacterium]
MRKFAVFGPVLALLMLLASSSAAGAQQGVTVSIGPGRDEASGTGTATLTPMGNQTVVTLRVANTNPEMLAHIHVDVCPGVGGIVFPLTNVRNGTSTTTIDADLATVLSQGRSINLHRSPQQGSIYVGCGNLAGAAAGTTGVGAVQVPRALPGTGESGSLAPLLAVAGVALLAAGISLRGRRRH